MACGDDQNSVLGAVDGRLGVAGVDYEEAEVEMVLKLGLMGSSYFMEDKPTQANLMIS